MKAANLIQFLFAAHYSYLVESEWEERGGIFLVAPPGALKTTLAYTMDNFNDCICMGDVNVRTLGVLRDDVLEGRYKTFVFGEMEKLYARHPATAENVIGHLRQFVEEGMRQTAHEDKRSITMPARCMVVAAMTPTTYQRHIASWIDSGFARRFLTLAYRLDDPDAIPNAIAKWKKLKFDLPMAQWDGRLKIAYNLTEQEARRLQRLLKSQAGTSTPFVQLSKTACILKHKFPDVYMDMIADVGEAMGKDGAKLKI